MEDIKISIIMPVYGVEEFVEKAIRVEAVGGYIEVTYPFDENVGLVMNPLPIIQNQIYCNSPQYDLDQISRELLYIQLALAI